jgi:CubicO group peptidase (beta-lactamase class C family)
VTQLPSSNPLVFNFSVSVPLLTAPVALSLAAEGRLDLDAPLRETLAFAPPRVSARHCLQQ